MAIFPKIQSPCPYQTNLAAVMDGDNCRMCKRQVHDLTAMSDAQRKAFLASCSGEVCVSYRLRPAIAVAVLATAMTALPMAAASQEPAPAAEPELQMELVIVAGGIHDPANVDFIEDAADQAMAELPVVYDDETPAATQAEGDAEPAPQPAKP